MLTILTILTENEKYVIEVEKSVYLKLSKDHIDGLG